MRNGAVGAVAIVLDFIDADNIRDSWPGSRQQSWATGGQTRAGNLRRGNRQFAADAEGAVSGVGHCHRKGVEEVEQVHADHFQRATHFGSEVGRGLACSKLT